MGQLAVGLGGAAVGAAFGNPALGFTIGNAIGGLLFPPDPIRIEGPRREDLRVSSSTHGRPIPEGFGVIRLPGNMIWSSQIREVQTTTEIGGKGGLGGPSQEQVSYTYFVDCSFAFAQGPAEAILRVFADGKPIYDVRDPNTTGAVLTATTKPGLTLRTYLGTEDQAACPTIQAAEGVDDTPAYRGTVYLTLESFDLTDFGNRIPQITAEVAFKATGSDSGRLSTDAGIPNFNDRYGAKADWTRDLVYTADASFSDGVNGLRAWTISGLQEIRSVTDTEIGIAEEMSTNSPWTVGAYSGRIYWGNLANSMSIDIIDPDSMTVIGYVGVFAGGGDFSHGVFGDNPATPDIAGFSWFMEGACLASPAGSATNTEQIFLLGFSLILDGPYLLDVTDPSATLGVVWNNSPPVTQPVNGIAEPAAFGQCVFWVLYDAGGNATKTLQKWEVDFGAKMINIAPDQFDFIGVTAFTAATFPSSIWDNDAASGVAFGPVYDETDGNLIFAMNTNTGSTIWKWNKVLDQIQWIVKTAVDYSPSTDSGQYSRIRNGRFAMCAGNGLGAGTYILIDTISGVVLADNVDMNASFSPWWNLDEWFWDDTYQVFTGTHNSVSMEQYFIGRKTGQGEALSDVVTLFSGENVNGAGLATDEFDVTQLVNDTVRGYAVTRRMPIKRAMEPLFATYDFDATEADDKIKFVKRGGTSVASITQADIVAAAELVRETRTQESELPERLELGYLDPALDYQENVAQAKRPRAPVPTMYSLDDQSIDLAIVFTAAEAKEIAERLLYTAWSQRLNLAFALGDNFIRLVPTDVITLTLDSGSVFILRIVKADTGVNHSQSYEAVVQDFTLQVASNAVADTSAGFTEADLPTSVNTRLCLIDAPYLRDIDATERQSIELKYAMAGYSPGWQSGTLWDSTDGVSYSPVARSTTPKTYGIVTNKLPTGMVNLTDTATTLTVAMVEGDLASVTQAQFIANDQVAIIGNPVKQNWEYVAFRDAVQDADGHYDVSTLLRGRRGTDAPEIADSHNNGELFIVVDRAAINRVLLALGDFNVLRYYRGVGRNDFLENAPIVPLASKGRPLMPHRPHHLSAVVDGSDNIDFGWNRSARVNFELTNNGSWNDGTLAEDSEAYEVAILDQPGGTEIRTIAVVAEAAEYTKAQLTADLATGTGAATLGVGSTTTFTRAAGSFVTDGFAAGQTIETAGFTDGANNGVFTVANVAALTLTIVEITLVAEAGTGDETIDTIRENDITFEVYQMSAQVGRGFSSAETTITL